MQSDSSQSYHSQGLRKSRYFLQSSKFECNEKREKYNDSWKKFTPSSKLETMFSNELVPPVSSIIQPRALQQPSSRIQKLVDSNGTITSLKNNSFQVSMRKTNAKEESRELLSSIKTPRSILDQIEPVRNPSDNNNDRKEEHLHRVFETLSYDVSNIPSIFY